MPTNAEFAGSGHDPMLPYPPAITVRRSLASAAADDVLPMPPFSRESMQSPMAAAAEVSATSGEAEEVVIPEPAAAAAPDPGEALAAEVAGRLESMADDLRRHGIQALLEAGPSREPIDAVLAAVLAGFLARR